MSYKDGLCFPSYETIAEKARCCRDTVYEAILALEDTGVFSWVQRIDRVAERVKDLFGQWMTSYRIVRRSNVYEFRDPLPCAEALNSFGNSYWTRDSRVTFLYGSTQNHHSRPRKPARRCFNPIWQEPQSHLTPSTLMIADKGLLHCNWPADPDRRQRHLYDGYAAQEAGPSEQPTPPPPRPDEGS